MEKNQLVSFMAVNTIKCSGPVNEEQHDRLFEMRKDFFNNASLHDCSKKFGVTEERMWQLLRRSMRRFGC